jgi:hypothetical protein
MTKNEGRALDLGDKITLNEKASTWTRGLTFEVERIKSWGVRCFVEGSEGAAYYDAPFDQIEPRQLEMADAAKPSEYPD